VFAFAFGIFVRQADGMRQLKHISASKISAITYVGRHYTDPAKIRAVTESLQRSQWYHLRRSALSEPRILLVRFRDGREWEMNVGLDRYGQGTIIQISPVGLSSGYAYNSDLIRVLETPY
jgi:hypothetical protein